jgi:long-chain fatty acid transport protein
LFLFSLTAPSRVAATPQDLFGFGGRTPGLAMTGASYACGYESVFANPAGLACTERRGLFVGLGAGGFRLSIDGERHPLAHHRGMTLGFQLPIPFGGFLEDRLVIGGGFFTPSEVVLRGEVNFPEVPQFTVLDRSQIIAVQVALGIDFYDIVDGLLVGVGASALADLVGDLLVRLNEENEFSSQIETQLVTSFAPVIGARYGRDEWSAGLVWRGELESYMKLDIVTADLPVMIPPLTLGGLVQYDPHTFVLEGSYRVADGWMLVGHGTLRLWNAFPGAQQRTTANSPLAPDPEFSTTISPRVAIERTVTDGPLQIQLRGGYAYEPTPAPPARIAPQRRVRGEAMDVPFRVLDNDRHVVTLGLGLRYDVDESLRIHIDLWGQLHMLAPREHLVPGSASRTDPMDTSGLILAGGWVLGAEL